MRKLIIALLSALVILSCETPTDPKNQPVEEPTIEEPAPEPQPVARYYVYDSARNLVDGGELLSTRSADGIIPASVESYVETYNAANTEDQLIITTEPIENIVDTNCEIWIVDSTTYDLKTNPMTGLEYNVIVSRVEVEGRREAWRLECVGLGNATLYVDRVPPDPIVVEPPTAEELYAMYSLYVIDADGHILFEAHCTEWEAMGYESLEQCYYLKRQAFLGETYGTGYTLISGYVYTEPN